ncbi:FAD-dependent oxidoreductase [Denitromonas iodatirespirans]|uniref:FAD-dependent oxidoreductase n=1 Tax=Denitromonas iodatirespirans TaxID=2795389 RepID=A0A944DBR3_DENI1|nr:FAD-dependent oxidoreductase [Denitromonas iodatirespirans]MBT0963569.1 FAD-dependent oxidoreductase [Denitromonas iodatirespirans]
MKRLVLLGGGHAHVHVLDALARTSLPDTEVVLVTPSAQQIYSGMLPGWIAGHYRRDEIAIPLMPLAQRAGVRFVQARGTGLDLDARQLQCDDGKTIDFDLLSIDTGPTTDTGIAGCAEHAIAVRPIDDFVRHIDALIHRAETDPAARLAIVGSGAAGVELAFALRQRLPALPLTLIGASAHPLDGLPGRLQRRARRLLAERHIHWLGPRRAIRIDTDGVTLDNGDTVAATQVLQVTGATAPAWPAQAGLATDTAGFIRVGPTLQSVSHPFVFAAGDVAAYADPRPKSGVFAVRAGPPLADNLRRLVTGQPLAPWHPQRRALYLISTGDERALAAWGPLCAEGGWVWSWKDRIDRAFVARFTHADT